MTDEFAALQAALDAVNDECAKLAGDIRRPPETAEISAHLAFMRECKPDVISRLLDAAEERDRLRILNNIRNHRLISERARAERAEAGMEELRKAVAELNGFDVETWPSHGNASLAIAAGYALTLRNLNEQRARAERLAKVLDETAITLSVLKGSFGEHTEARGMLEGQINKIRAALAAEPEVE